MGLENIALWHERDISHSGAERVVLPDATIALDYMQHIATRIVEGMTVHTDRMRENIELTHGALFSQRALTALVESGMSRDDAYRLVQESAQRAWDEETSFRELIAAKAPQLDLDAVFDYDAYLEHVPEVIARLDRLARVILYTCGQKEQARLDRPPVRPRGEGARRGGLRVRDPRAARVPADAVDLGAAPPGPR